LKDAIIEWIVLNRYEITFVKNESYRVMVICKGNCEFLALCSKMGDMHTYQIKIWKGKAHLSIMCWCSRFAWQRHIWLCLITLIFSNYHCCWRVSVWVNVSYAAKINKALTCRRRWWFIRWKQLNVTCECCGEHWHVSDTTKGYFNLMHWCYVGKKVHDKKLH